MVLLGGYLQRRRWLDRIAWIVWIVSDGSYWLNCISIGILGFTSDKLDFYALDGIMGEIGLILAVWDRRTGWDVGGMGVGLRD